MIIGEEGGSMISEPHLKYWGLNGILALKDSMISKPHQKIEGLN